MKVEYLIYLQYIVKKMCDAGCIISIVDVSYIETLNGEDKWGANRIRMLELFYNSLLERNENINALSLCPLQFNSAFERTIVSKTRGSKLLFEFLDAITSNFGRSISIGIQSYFATHETKSIDTSVRLNKGQKKKCIGIVMEAVVFETQLRALLVGSEILIIQNGRWRAQPFLKQLGEECGNRVLFLNSGGVRNYRSGFVLSKYQPQDIRFYEPQPTDLDPLITDDPIDDMFEAWVEDNKSKSKEFIRESTKIRRQRQLPQINRVREPYLLLLSSSPSEYDFFRKIHWQWKDQIDGFVRASYLAKKHGLRVVVRLHPNQFNYSFRDLNALVTKIKHLADEIHMPWSNISTYDLIGNSRGVLVWESTTGLEAAVLGVPSASLIDTHFSKRSGIPVLRNELDLHNWIKSPILPLKRDIARTVHFLQFFGELIQEHSPLNLSEFADKLDNLSKSRRRSKGRLAQIKYILQKTQCLTELQNLTPHEVHSMVRKLGGRVGSEKVLLRLASVSKL